MKLWFITVEYYTKLHRKQGKVKFEVEKKLPVLKKAKVYTNQKV